MEKNLQYAQKNSLCKIPNSPKIYKINWYRKLGRAKSNLSEVSSRMRSYDEFAPTSFQFFTPMPSLKVESRRRPKVIITFLNKNVHLPTKSMVV